MLGVHVRDKPEHEDQPAGGQRQALLRPRHQIPPKGFPAAKNHWLSVSQVSNLNIPVDGGKYQAKVIDIGHL